MVSHYDPPISRYFTISTAQAVWVAHMVPRSNDGAYNFP